jgi:hypothetical protein
MSENIPYIIAEDGYYYVAYKEKVKVPEIVVSSKGVANGLSEEYNDGWDFGPDSYSPTSTSAIPYTKTSGIQEAWNYAVSVAVNYNITLSSILAPAYYFIPEIHLLSGVFIIKKGINLSSSLKIQNFKLTGDQSMSPYIVMETNDGLFTFDPSTFANTNLEIDNIAPLTAPGYTPAYIIKADFSSVNTYTNLFQSYNLDTGGEFQQGIVLNSVIQVNLYNYQTYCPNGDSFTNIDLINYYGGQLGGGVGLITSSSYPHTYNNVKQIAIYSGHDILPISLENMYGYLSIYDSKITSITLNATTLNTLTIIDCNHTIKATNPMISEASAFSVISLLFVRGLDTGYTSDLQFYLNDTSLLSIGELDIKGMYNPNNLELPSLSPSTPSVPASGTAQQNTNAYAVKAYVNGGAITEIQITINGTAYTVYSNSTASAVYEGFTLPAGASITLTYSTAPTWSWLPE